ncbi:hypothetical protein LCGC14_1514460 [marine sediment metagenome]|uniref:Uncharacterized protein n=1 Tax=marine sediment metagenome TaxID=412755 RepID=A0A0F9LG20_9ZZZZ
MSVLHGKRSIKLSVFSVLLAITALLTFTEYTPAQSTDSLETECVAFISSGTFTVPASLTPQELCKVVVALFGNEWEKAAKLQATILVVNDHDIRLAAAEAAIAALQAQDTATLQPQIDAINAKLANMAAALQ